MAYDLDKKVAFILQRLQLIKRRGLSATATERGRGTPRRLSTRKLLIDPGAERRPDRTF